MFSIWKAATAVIHPTWAAARTQRLRGAMARLCMGPLTESRPGRRAPETQTGWRRRWDSKLRQGFPHRGLANRCAGLDRHRVGYAFRCVPPPRAFVSRVRAASWAFLPSATHSAAPVPDRQTFEPPEVAHVRCDEYQLVDLRDGGDLSVGGGGGPSAAAQACPLAGVPGRRLLIVGDDRERRSDDLLEVRLDGAALLRGGKAGRSVAELVPDDRAGGDLPLVLLDPRESEPANDFETLADRI
jgi:hypothetical protein